MLPPVGFRSARAEAPKPSVFPIAPVASGKTQSRQPKARLSPEVTGLVTPPLLETLRDMPEIPFTMGIKAGDPSLDKDPFFLRAQRWTTETDTPDDGDEQIDRVAFRQTETQLEIALRGSSKVLRLEAPLRPLSTDSQWIYLAAQSEDLFQEKSPGEVPGEGIFLISIAELTAAKTALGRVPVYFFPLPGGDWTGKVSVDTIEFTETVLMTDANGDALPVPESDIEKVVFAEKLHLTMSLGAAARTAALMPNSGTEATLPLPGSTAGFGMLFTGLNPRYPELNLFDGPAQSSSLAPFLEKAYTMVFGTPAYAEDGDSPNAKLLKNLLRVTVVVGIALIGAVALRATVYRSRFKQKDKDEPYKGLWGWVKKEFRHNGDVFAHNLTFLATLPSNWLGNSVEYIVDRHFTQLGAGKNTLLRRFLNQTVYQSRDMTENIPVNWRTAALGIGPLGFTDTALVALQVYFIVPWMVQGIAVGFPGMQEKLNAAFDLNNPDVETYNRNETIRNLAAYTTQGASLVSADLKGQLITVLGPEVDAELRKLGLDPTAPEVKTLRDKKFEELFAAVAKQVGLPGKEDFLFDASTVWAIGQRLIGNKVEGSVPGLPLGSNLIGEQRPGAIVPALKYALAEARSRLKNDPGDKSLVSAVAILEEVMDDLSLTTNLVKQPFKWIWGKLTGKSPPSVLDEAKRMRRARQTLVALTYDGPVSEGLKFIPGAWGEKYKEPGCQVAGQIFRRAFSATLSGDKQIYQGPTKDHFQATEALHPDFEKEAAQLLKSRYLFEYELLLGSHKGDEEKALRDLRHAHRAEFRLVMDEKIHSRALSDIDAAKPYKPAYVSWYGRLQQRRARRVADQKFAEKFNGVFEATEATPEQTKFWTAAYSDALMNAVGIFPDYDAVEGLEERIDAKAQQLTEGQLKDIKLQHFLTDLDEEGRAHFKANLHAENVIAAYRDIVPNLVDEEAQKEFKAKYGVAFNPLTATKPEKKDFKRFYGNAALSTAQPGRFQWRRQRLVNRESRTRTRFWRTLDSFFPVEHHKTGLLSAIMRNVPTLYDLWIGNLRSYRASITMATGIYWFNYLVWGVSLPTPLWILALMTRFTVVSPAQWLTRLFRMQGLQAMGGVKDMTFYAFLYSWATFWGTIPTLLFADDLKQLLEGLQKLVGAKVDAVSAQVVAGVETCSTLIGTVRK